MVYQFRRNPFTRKLLVLTLYRRVLFVRQRGIRRKIQIKSGRFQVSVTSKLWGLILSNLISEVVNISYTTYKFGRNGSNSFQTTVG